MNRDSIAMSIESGIARVFATVLLLGIIVSGGLFGVRLIVFGIRGLRRKEWSPPGLFREPPQDELVRRGWPVRGIQAVVASVWAISLGAIFIAGVPLGLFACIYLWGYRVGIYGWGGWGPWTWRP